MGSCRSGRKRRSFAKARYRSATTMTTGKGLRTSGKKKKKKKKSSGTGRYMNGKRGRNYGKASRSHPFAEPSGTLPREISRMYCRRNSGRSETSSESERSAVRKKKSNPSFGKGSRSIPVPEWSGRTKSLTLEPSGRNRSGWSET